MHKNTKRLHQLMRKHHVNSVVVGDLLGRDPHTVRVWRVRETTRPIPDHTLQLLEVKLQQQGGGE